jgi:hypothetical protein
LNTDKNPFELHPPRLTRAAVRKVVERLAKFTFSQSLGLLSRKSPADLTVRFLERFMVSGGASTVQAAQLAVQRARHTGFDTQGAVFAADAFFPFTDAPEILCDAGVRAGVVPAGGKRFEEIEAFFHRRQVRVSSIPEAYRGFCRH